MRTVNAPLAVNAPNSALPPNGTALKRAITSAIVPPTKGNYIEFYPNQGGGMLQPAPELLLLAGAVIEVGHPLDRSLHPHDHAKDAHGNDQPASGNHQAAQRGQGGRNIVHDFSHTGRLVSLRRVREVPARLQRTELGGLHRRQGTPGKQPRTRPDAPGTRLARQPLWGVLRCTVNAVMAHARMGQDISSGNKNRLLSGEQKWLHTTVMGWW